MFGGTNDVYEYGRHGLSPRTERICIANGEQVLRNSRVGRHFDKVNATFRLHRILLEDALSFYDDENERRIAESALDVSQASDGLRRLASTVIDQLINGRKRNFLDAANEGEVEDLSTLNNSSYRGAMIGYKDEATHQWVALFAEDAELWELELALSQYRKTATIADRRADHVESVIEKWSATGDTSGTLGELLDRLANG